MPDDSIPPHKGEPSTPTSDLAQSKVDAARSMTERERANLRDFTSALAEHPDWQKDWQEYDATADALRQVWRQRMRAAGAESAADRDDTHPLGYSLDHQGHRAQVELMDRALAWLFCRYWRLFEAAARELELAPNTVEKHLRSWLGGDWNQVAYALEHEAVRSAIIHPEWPHPYERPQDLHTRADSVVLPWSPVWAFYAPAPGEACEDYIKGVVAGIRAAWPEYMPDAPRQGRRVGQRPLVGGRPRGGSATQSFTRRVRLYAFYRTHPAPPLTWPKFTDEWNACDNPAGAAIEDTLKAATLLAVQCMAPDPAVPTHLADFQPEGQGKYILTGEQHAFFREFLPIHLRPVSAGSEEEELRPSLW